MPGGRPTDDPKTELVAFRLAPRHLRYLERRARRERTTLSEALRRVLDKVAAYTPVIGTARKQKRSKPRLKRDR